MKFTNAQLLELPQRALHDREYRHKWLREREAKRRQLVQKVNMFFRELYPDAIDAEEIEQKESNQ